MSILRAVMIGDVVGEPGLVVLERDLPGLIREYAADFVTVNGENAAEGFGLTGDTLARILAAGADVVTSGNHVWEKREFWPVLEQETRVLRPANYPAGTAGRGWVKVEKIPAEGGAPVSWVVVNLQGRELMPPIDCPFKGIDLIIDALGGESASYPPVPEDSVLGESVPGGSISRGITKPGTLALVDFHAESTREKEALAYYLDGRVALVAGTHTHVQTADDRILPRGTGYITDLGMTGVTDSVIGMDTQICLNRARNQVLYRMECARGEAAVQGIVAE
ncbi:MAG: YmdB family metallophosphoesterase, partial [Treponema sp.]|nr:YmdB family metallophosphoesterase [Treponema sp.]